MTDKKAFIALTNSQNRFKKLLFFHYLLIIVVKAELRQSFFMCVN